MKEIYITELFYKNAFFKVYLINDKYTLKGAEKNYQLQLELENILNSNIVKYNRTKKKLILASTSVFSLGLFLGVILNKNLDKLKIDQRIIDNYDSIQKELNIKSDDIDEKLLKQYLEAIYKNDNLSNEEKILFVKKFNFINANKDNINFDELFNTLENIDIEYKDEEFENILGSFTIKNNMPLITIYKNANQETLTHEIYHALKHNKYYWDNTYYYDGNFIGTFEYEKLSNSEQEKCQKYMIYGSLLEEANTTNLTALDLESNLNNLTYKKETYIYKIYEEIFGKEKLNSIFFKPNPTAEFLNLLLSVGCSKEEAITIVSRLDVFNKLNNGNNKSLDYQYLTYQICDDLAYVYYQKNNNIDNNLLKITILSLINEIDLTKIQTDAKKFKMQKLFNELVNDNLSINNYLNDIIKANYATEYGVMNIDFDYYSKNNPILEIEVNNYDKAIFNIINNEVNYVKIEGDSETSQFIYKLYTDYYAFALNSQNDENYAKYFASIYANTILNVDEKAEILEKYDTWGKILNQMPSYSRVLLFENYDKINNVFENYNINIKK